MKQQRKINWTNCKGLNSPTFYFTTVLSAICMLCVSPQTILISCYLKKPVVITKTNRKTRNFPNHCIIQDVRGMLEEKAISDWFIIKNDLTVCSRSIFIRQFYLIQPFLQYRVYCGKLWFTINKKICHIHLSDGN